MASFYDNWAANHESQPTSVDRQLVRAQELVTQFPVNSRRVTVPVRPQPNIIQVQNRVLHPPYQLGYAPGSTVLSLPSRLANPAPVLNQHMHTSAHTHSRFTERDLPSILFRLEPPRDTFRIGNNDMPVPILYEHGVNYNRPVVTNRGATLRYFSFLPRYIQSDVSGALLEYWFRLDYRLEMNDILMRIETPPSGMVTSNTMNMRRNRFRHNIGVNAWMDCRSFPPRNDVDIVHQLTERQICLNTCMELEAVGFLKPSFNDIGCAPSSRVGYVPALIVRDYFLTNLVSSIPTRRMVATMALLKEAQDLAVDLGHGTAHDNYRLLAERDAPPWWNDRRQGIGQVQGRQITRLGLQGQPLTWGEWMVDQVGPNMAVGIAKRAKTRGQRV
ncbi:hypothetical protein LTR70_000659 [Exophiala xenobiotica]|nr:hypothetical protein LTR70_000659 [Exophiala xenobiotica]